MQTQQSVAPRFSFKRLGAAPASHQTPKPPLPPTGVPTQAPTPNKPKQTNATLESYAANIEAVGRRLAARFEADAQRKADNYLKALAFEGADVEREGKRVDMATRELKAVLADIEHVGPERVAALNAEIRRNREQIAQLQADKEWRDSFVDPFALFPTTKYAKAFWRESFGTISEVETVCGDMVDRVSKGAGAVNPRELETMLRNTHNALGTVKEWLENIGYTIDERERAEMERAARGK